MQVPALNLKAEVLYDEVQLTVNTQTAAQQSQASLHLQIQYLKWHSNLPLLFKCLNSIFYNK